jgi:hypothetical protein
MEHLLHMFDFLGLILSPAPNTHTWAQFLPLKVMFDVLNKVRHREVVWMATLHSRPHCSSKACGLKHAKAAPGELIRTVFQAHAGIGS